MGRTRKLKGNMDKCSYCDGKVEWAGYDTNEYGVSDGGYETGEYQCQSCFITWHQNGRAFTIKECNE